jgi:DNA-binding MarR family transcriptional regulator
MQLTTLEQQVLKSHFKMACEQCGAKTPNDLRADNYSVTDARELAALTKIPMKSIKGVIGSLTKKGLVTPDEGPEGEDHLWLSEAAIDIIEQNQKLGGNVPVEAPTHVREYANKEIDIVNNINYAIGFFEFKKPDTADGTYVHPTGLKMDVHSGQYTDGRNYAVVTFRGTGVKKERVTRYVNNVVKKGEKEYCNSIFQSRIQRLIRAAKKA